MNEADNNQNKSPNSESVTPETSGSESSGNQGNSTGNGQMTPENEKIMSVLCYISFLVIVPLLTSKDNPRVKFHIKQGLALFSISVVVWTLSSILSFAFLYFIPFMFMLFPLINLGVIILAIVGIVNVLQDKQEPLPIVGPLAEVFKI